VAGSCEYGDEPSGSGATELVTLLVTILSETSWLLCQSKQ
jgi:hypothetical protein